MPRVLRELHRGDHAGRPVSSALGTHPAYASVPHDPRGFTRSVMVEYRGEAEASDIGQELPSSEHSELLAAGLPDPTQRHYVASRVARWCPTLQLLTLSAASGLLLMLGAGGVSLRSGRTHAASHQIGTLRGVRGGGTPPEASQPWLGDASAGRA